ncbi:MAG: ADP-ribosylglycohydrolase family protein, partial [Pseudomonadota bacterium]|nr:ADP-ribosylglycohydrolase family protein [Pseudomonadota bacterium]
MRGPERQYIKQELTQRREEGCNVDALEPQIDQALADGAEDNIIRLYDTLVALDVEADFPYAEPSTLEEIKALRPDGPRRM